MDTRSKILSPADALEIQARPIAIVTGTFDVLRAAHARELEAVRLKSGDAALLVVVLPGCGELLSQRARAELVAALRVVDYVVAARHEESETLIRSIQADYLFRMEAADEQRLQELRGRLRERL